MGPLSKAPPKGCVICFTWPLSNAPAKDPCRGLSQGPLIMAPTKGCVGPRFSFSWAPTNYCVGPCYSWAPQPLGFSLISLMNGTALTMESPITKVAKISVLIITVTQVGQ